MTLLKWFIKYSMSHYKLNDPTLCDKLANLGVHTTNDLLLKTDATTLADQSNAASEDLTKLYSCITREYAKKLVKLKDAVQMQKESQLITRSDCESIDQLLNFDGIQSGQIVQICGADSTGKTQLCFNFMMEAIKFRRSVLYIDTQSSFDSVRLHQLAVNKSINVDLIGLIDVVSVFSVQQLFDSLHLAMTDGRYSLFVIDSLAGLLDPLFAGPGEKNALFNQTAEIGRMLTGMRQANPQRNIILVNYSSRRFSRLLGHIYSLTIQLTPKSIDEKSQIFQAELQYRNKLPSQYTWCNFTITDSGIADDIPPLIDNETLTQKITSQELQEDQVLLQCYEEQRDTMRPLEQQEQQEQQEASVLEPESDDQSFSQVSNSLANYLSASPLSVEFDLEETAEERLQHSQDSPMAIMY